MRNIILSVIFLAIIISINGTGKGYGVTSVSVTPSMGITATVSNPNSTPNISITTGSASAPTSATTGTMTVSMTNPVLTITPTGACTFNATGGAVGQMITFAITTSGTSSFVLTWGSNYKSTGTLSTGTVTAKTFLVTFLCTSANPTWVEQARTIAQ